MTLPRDLVALVDESEVIVRGHILSAQIEKHAQLAHLLTVVVTLRVEERLKGQTEDTYTFRQAVLDPRDRANSLGYKPGQQVLLLLIKPNAYGLSSPAGLEQGRFRIRVAADGSPRALNGIGNVGLLRGLIPKMQKRGLQVAPEIRTWAEKPAPGPIPLDGLRDLIRQIAKTH